MSRFRIALANLPFPATPEESVAAVEEAIAQASAERADLVCFPECFVPGYRVPGKRVPPPDPAFLERAWSSAAAAAARADLAVILGTERVVDGALRIAALHEAEPGGHRPTVFADPANSFHEKAVLCRAAENTCFFATVNCAGVGSPTTSAVVRPDGTLLCHQPYGQPGLLVADIDVSEATGLLAARCRTFG
jgi:predicted amidohydrolase